MIPEYLNIFGHEMGRDERSRGIRRWKFHVTSVRNFYFFMLGGGFWGTGRRKSKFGGIRVENSNENQ